MAVIPASEYVNSTAYSPDFVITGDERSILPFDIPKSTGTQEPTVRILNSPSRLTPTGTLNTVVLPSTILAIVSSFFHPLKSPISSTLSRGLSRITFMKEY